MTCDRYQASMMEALYGELDGERRAEFDAHLCECAECAALFSELQTTASMMNRRRRPDPGPEFWKGYWDRLQERVAGEDKGLVDASRFARRRSLGSWGYRVAAVVAVLAAGVWMGRTVFSPGPVSEPRVAITTAPGDSTPRGAETQQPADAGVEAPELAQIDQAPAPIDAPAGERATPSPRDGDAPTVLVSNNDEALRYIERSHLLLLAVLNGDPADSVGFDVHKQRANELVRTASSVRESSDDRRVRELVAQLELILREIAHIEQSSDADAVEMIRSRVDREGVMFRINVEQMRSENAPRSTGGAID